MSKYLGRIAPSAVFSKLFSGFLTGPVPVLEDRGYKSSEAVTCSPYVGGGVADMGCGLYLPLGIFCISLCPA